MNIMFACGADAAPAEADRPAEGGRGEEAEGVGALAAALLGRLQQQARPSVAPLTTPVQRHADRVPSGERGLSLVALGALETFYAAQGALGKAAAGAPVPPLAEGGSPAWARSPLAALGLHAGLLLGGERARHLSGSASTATVLIIVAIPVVLLCILFSCSRAGARRDEGMPPSHHGGAAARNLLEHQQPSKSRSPPVAGTPPRTRAQPSPPAQPSQSRSPAPSVQALSPAPPPAVPQPAPAPAAQLPKSAPVAAPLRTSPRNAAADDGGIPILCRSLVLPNLESCFNISMEALSSRRSGNITIKGASARALLESSIEENQLTMRSLGSDAKPRVTITREGRQLKIYGRDERLFGTLEPVSGPNDFALLVDGQVKMKVLAEPGPELHFRAFATSGRAVAAAGSSGAEWTLQVKANVDAILIAACMLSMIFFAPTVAAAAPKGAAKSPAYVSSRSPPPAAMRAPPGGSTSPRPAERP